MASDRRGSRSKKDNEMAAYMKKMGIRRRTGVCPLCYRSVAIPMDRHFSGGLC